MTCHSLLFCFCGRWFVYRTFLATAVIACFIWSCAQLPFLISTLALIISDSSLHEGSESCSINFIKIPLVEAKSIPVNFVKVSLHEWSKSVTVYLIEISLLGAKRCTAARKTWNIIRNLLSSRITHIMYRILQKLFSLWLLSPTLEKRESSKHMISWKGYIELNMSRKIYLKESNRFANPNTSPARESIFLLASPLPPENLHHMTDVIFFIITECLYFSHCAIDFPSKV